MAEGGGRLLAGGYFVFPRLGATPTEISAGRKFGPAPATQSLAGHFCFRHTAVCLEGNSVLDEVAEVLAAIFTPWHATTHRYIVFVPRVSGARTLTSHLAEPPVVAQVVRGQDAGLDMAAQIVPCATDSDPRWAGFLLASARFGGRFDWTWPTDKHTLQSLELASYARCASLTNPTIANALWAKPHGDAPFRPRRFHMSRCLV